MDIKKRFGTAVKARRGQSGMSQEEMAHRIGADQAYVSRVEGGQMNVTLETLELISIALQTSAATLLPSASIQTVKADRTLDPKTRES